MLNKIIVQTESGDHKIDKNIYGHFAEHLGRCIYDGIWVGEKSSIPNIRGMRKDVVEALKGIKAPVLRWPGGCFADEYHWKDGVGSREERRPMVNSNWGGVVEDNQFGTHEFFDLCEQIGAEPYICGNVGSGTIHEMQEWIEYMNWPDSTPMSEMRIRNGRKEPFNIKYFGIGNENWGCGGKMTPEYYASVYKRYNTFVRDYNGQKIFRIACGPRNDDYHWTDVMMRDARCCMDGLALHYYSRMFSSGESTTEERGSATDFPEDEWALILRKAHNTEELVHRHSAIMDRYDPEKRVALIVDEWGTWFEVEPGTHPRFLYQQNTMRDALVASISLNIFNEYSDRVRMANIAQTVNVLQAMVLTDGPRMLLTPTYHVFDMYKGHQDATSLPVYTESEQYSYGEYSMDKVSASASRADDGSILVTMNNLDTKKPAEIRTVLRGTRIKNVSGRILSSSSMHLHNTFDEPDRLSPQNFAEFKAESDELKLTVPPMSVVALRIES
ncbi:alpha-N-arabinofuranosidase [Marispirochaeta aestuarii]|uniref:non-reducing end alpha-L-arabinofuranosidase n=1 Tax=Marispirochaeta aestuarii TaxID=1963862 RepID=A0A1Y1RVL9_9SPIO|nr:alpha-N-arabinofuranosidase [Marispirochaeta aestuarii]ORC34101.1 alpha-N-arabinofuranosidase [Marispirochaeta aestuarii]